VSRIQYLFILSNSLGSTLLPNSTINIIWMHKSKHWFNFLRSYSTWFDECKFHGTSVNLCFGSARKSIQH